MTTGTLNYLSASVLTKPSPPAGIGEPPPRKNRTVALGHGLAGSDLDNLWDKTLFVTRPEYGRKFMQRMHHPFHEVLACLYLNNDHAAIAYNSYFRGELASALAHLPTLVSTARRLDTSGVLLAHNPIWCAGSELPDLSLVRQHMQTAGVTVHDFLLISNGNTLSMRAHGAL